MTTTKPAYTGKKRGRKPLAEKYGWHSAKPKGPEFNVEIAEPFLPLLTEKARFKAYYGGRGGAKSWNFARALIVFAMQDYPDEQGSSLIVCAREYQSTIRDSVHRVVAQQIRLMGLADYFEIGQATIKNYLTQAEFVFKGIRRDPDGFRSLEGGKRFWFEEAHNISKESWEIIEPTARRPGSEIWCSWNRHDETDPTDEMFIGPKAIPYPRAIVREVNWRDNPWFGGEMEKTRLHTLRTDPEAYDHIWEGKPKRVTEACIFKNKYKILSFETPSWAKLRAGADFGFSVDPAVVVRFWMGPPLEELDLGNPKQATDTRCLYIDQEAYAVGVDLNKMKSFYERIEGIHQIPIGADNARPETISYLKGEGFNIFPAEKWKGSVEDGISHLRGFDWIYIHEECKWSGQEARLYSYKVEEKTGLVTSDIEDKNNHVWDSVRYGLDGFIQRRGGLGVWRKLSKHGVRR